MILRLALAKAMLPPGGLLLANRYLLVAGLEYRDWGDGETMQQAWKAAWVQERVSVVGRVLMVLGLLPKADSLDGLLLRPGVDQQFSAAICELVKRRHWAVLDQVRWQAKLFHPDMGQGEQGRTKTAIQSLYLFDLKGLK